MTWLEIQRTQIKLESVPNKIADLECQNDEYTGLSNRLEHWENLNTNGGEVKEKGDKKRITFESWLDGLKQRFDQQLGEPSKTERKVERSRMYPQTTR